MPKYLKRIRSGNEVLRGLGLRLLTLSPNRRLLTPLTLEDSSKRGKFTLR